MTTLEKSFWFKMGSISKFYDFVYECQPHKHNIKPLKTDFNADIWLYPCMFYS